MAQVTCSKKDGPDLDHRIDGIGGPAQGGGNWFRDLDAAIADIEAGRYVFYTSVNGVRANVLVKRHPVSGRKYLTTSPDGYQPNNLLKLPDCPR